MIDCRVLPHQVGDGPTNMATDEALLDSVARDPTCTVVRTYSWSVPTLSLGYFQAYADVEADPRWADQAIVRRATGGGALWHDHEITYAVVVPVTHRLARPSVTLYQAIHHAIGATLREFGVAAVRRGEVEAGIDARADRPFLCFQDHDANDLVVGRTKLVGSAQRRRAGAVLQHGSLLLARSTITPELPGLQEILGSLGQRPHDPTESDLSTPWINAIRDALARLLGTEVDVQDFTDWERDRADILRREVYADPGWTRRR